MRVSLKQFYSCARYSMRVRATSGAGSVRAGDYDTVDGCDNRREFLCVCRGEKWLETGNTNPRCQQCSLSPTCAWCFCLSVCLSLSLCFSVPFLRYVFLSLSSCLSGRLRVSSVACPSPTRPPWAFSENQRQLHRALQKALDVVFCYRMYYEWWMKIFTRRIDGG